eukprot:CAMPEP_0113684330 /NCGR_PEP_ID=MMETSP0038_2-20120614/13930_1 /TAXON_ID=2898 /ORGANISM="Cryptomonas paramecium" /LENGTH=200 /DNA_ID=CAMNT_0000604041 /DNA_START=15 /DNA_END=614 /DNA_ORIENTATION=+ /assembly_acc=CAM_ASM_000170
MTANKHRRREMLTREKAREIFMVKEGTARRSRNAMSVALGVKYGVGAKTIRDIWTGRTWFDSTCDLWTEDEHPVRRANRRSSSSYHALTANANSENDNTMNPDSPSSDSGIPTFDHSNMVEQVACASPHADEAFHLPILPAIRTLSEEISALDLDQLTKIDLIRRLLPPLPTISPYSSIHDACSPLLMRLAEASSTASTG